MTFTYRFSDDDLKLVLNFTRDYHLEESKPVSGRTNQGARNFGGEMDAFLPGKLIELGVAKILEKLRQPPFSLGIDYKIYTNTEVKNQADPDIIKVNMNGANERAPNLHIEIKRHSEGDLWLGMRVDQLNQTLAVKGADTKNVMFMIHASLGFDDSKNKKQRDVVGAILKKMIPIESLDLEEFSNFSDLYCKIEYAYSINSLLERGKLYPRGGIIPTTPFPLGANAYTAKSTLRKNYSLLEKFPSGCNKLKMEIEGTGETTDYSDWKISGNFELINTPSNKKLLYCHSDVVAFNDYFGVYMLDRQKTYKFHFVNKLEKNSTKNIDDYWFFIKRLDELISEKQITSLKDCLTYIAKNI